MAYVGAFTEGQLRSSYWSLAAIDALKVMQEAAAHGRRLHGDALGRFVALKWEDSAHVQHNHVEGDASTTVAITVTIVDQAPCHAPAADAAESMLEVSSRRSALLETPARGRTAPLESSDNTNTSSTEQSTAVTTTVVELPGSVAHDVNPLTDETHQATKIFPPKAPPSCRTREHVKDKHRRTRIGSLHALMAASPDPPVDAPPVYSSHTATATESKARSSPVVANPLDRSVFLGAKSTKQMTVQHAARMKARRDSAIKREAAHTHAMHSRFPNICAPFREMSMCHFDLVDVDTSHIKVPDAVQLRDKVCH